MMAQFTDAYIYASLGLNELIINLMAFPAIEETEHGLFAQYVITKYNWVLFRLLTTHTMLAALCSIMVTS